MVMVTGELQSGSEVATGSKNLVEEIKKWVQEVKEDDRFYLLFDNNGGGDSATSPAHSLFDIADRALTINYDTGEGVISDGLFKSYAAELARLEGQLLRIEEDQRVKKIIKNEDGYIFGADVTKTLIDSIKALISLAQSRIAQASAR